MSGLELEKLYHLNVNYQTIELEKLFCKGQDVINFNVLFFFWLIRSLIESTNLNVINQHGFLIFQNLPNSFTIINFFSFCFFFLLIKKAALFLHHMTGCHRGHPL